MRLTPELAGGVRALARDIVLCFWTRHFTLTVPLSTQVYEWVPVNCGSLKVVVTCLNICKTARKIWSILDKLCF